MPYGPIQKDLENTVLQIEYLFICYDRKSFYIYTWL